MASSVANPGPPDRADKPTSRRQAHGLASYPSVLYKCDSSFYISDVSANVADLINLRGGNVIGSRAFTCDRVFSDDIGLIDDKLKELRAIGSAFLVHRLVDDGGRCIWVAHSLCRDPGANSEHWLGCIIPLPSDRLILNLDQASVARFIHKIGNYFQLLVLLISPLKKTLPQSIAEIDALEETVEKAIGITQAFADYSQRPSWASEVRISEVLTNAINARRFLFVQAGIVLRENIEGDFKDVTIPGDSALLESAIGNILENAIEATEANGEIGLDARIENWATNKSSVIVINIIDTGCGIAHEDLSKVTMPFYSTKADHNGLGLSMASRFIELHGGTMRVTREHHKGTAVRITLPVAQIPL